MSTGSDRSHMFVIGAAALALALVHVACGSQASVVPSPTSLPTPPIQENVPRILGTNLLVSVIDERGQTVTEGTFQISVEFETQVNYNYSYSQSLTSIFNGVLGIQPPPPKLPAQMFLQVVTPDGKKSDTLVVRNGEFWSAVDPDRDYVAAHTFDLGKSGKVSELVYLRPTERAPSNQRNVPSAPGTAILISVIDEQGLPVEEGTIVISVENQVVPQWDFAYSVDLSSVLPDGLLSVSAPPGRVPATVAIQVVTPTGEASDTLVIGGNEFWQAVVATDLDYVAVHEFDLAKSGTTSSAVYITVPQP